MVSEISEINQTMTSEFSGLKIFTEGTENNQIITGGFNGFKTFGGTGKLVKIIYGDNKKLANFIKRLGSDQTITNNFELPAAAMHLKDISGFAPNNSLSLCYELVVVTECEDDANQVTEQILALVNPPLALNQRGNKFALKSKYAKVELYANHLYAEPVVELVGKTLCTRRYCFSVETNYGDKPNQEIEKEQQEDNPENYCQEDEICVSNLGN